MKVRFVVSVKDLDRDTLNCTTCPMATSVARRLKPKFRHVTAGLHDVAISPVNKAFNLTIADKGLTAFSKVMQQQRKSRSCRKAFYMYADVPKKYLA